MNKIIEKSLNEENISYDEVYKLAQLANNELDILTSAAKNIRDNKHGRLVHLRALIEFSNYCHCNCGYCGLNKNNKELKRYRLPVENIIETAWEAYQAGYQTIVLQSGEDPWYTQKIIVDIIKNIKRFGEIAITLSLGVKSFADLKAFRLAGADRYLIKHETSDIKLYQALHGGQSPEKRFQMYQKLHQLGYQVGGGFMVGLPPWSSKALADNLWLLKTFNLDMAGLGPFIAQDKSALGQSPMVDFKETIKALAIIRLMIPKILLPATTALETLKADSLIEALEAGANVIMPKATPIAYRKLYNIYPRSENTLTLKEQKEKLEKKLLSKNYQLSSDLGHAL